MEAMSSPPSLGRHRHEDSDMADDPLSPADAAIGLLALSQMPQRRTAEYRALLGAETPDNLTTVIESAIGMISQLLTTAAAARREPVEDFVARYRQAMLHARDDGKDQRT